jgi:hypothetical protein
MVWEWVVGCGFSAATSTASKYIVNLGFYMKQPRPQLSTGVYYFCGFRPGVGPEICTFSGTFR